MFFSLQYFTGSNGANFDSSVAPTVGGSLFSTDFCPYQDLVSVNSIQVFVTCMISQSASCLSKMKPSECTSVSSLRLRCTIRLNFLLVTLLLYISGTITDSKLHFNITTPNETLGTGK